MRPRKLQMVKKTPSIYLPIRYVELLGWNKSDEIMIAFDYENQQLKLMRLRK